MNTVNRQGILVERGRNNMDNKKVGQLIRELRKERYMTQAQLAEQLHVSDKTVSKWETGKGGPELSLLTEISKIFDIDLHNLLAGELNQNQLRSINMKKVKLYICPNCGNVVTAISEAAVSCCGRKLKEATPTKASQDEKLMVELIENDFFVTSQHEMTKEHYISFVALLTADAIIMRKQYPEWDLSVRIPRIAHGRLLWYCSRHGLFYQEI